MTRRFRDFVKAVTGVSALFIMTGAVAALPTTATSAPLPPLATSARPALSPAFFNRTTLDYSSKLSLSREADRYQIMVLSASAGSKVEELREANPRLIVLMYSNALYASSSDSAGVLNCTGYAADQSKSRASWYLRSKLGGRILNASHQDLMDMGNKSYQKACVGRAVSQAKKYGFSGIMFGGLSAQSSWLLPAGTVIARYPTTASWQAAMQSFLNYAGKSVRAHHMQVMADLSGVTGKLWQRWTAPLNGSEKQTWTAGSEGARQQVPYWPANLADVAWSESHHKFSILNSYSRTGAGNLYGLASMLLVADGYSSYATNNTNDSSYEAWYAAYGDAQQLGSPLGPYKKLANKVYERSFQNGIVLVNPTTHKVESVGVGGAYQTGSRKSSSVPMAATTGRILFRQSFHPAPVPPDGAVTTSGSSTTGSSSSSSSSGGSPSSSGGSSSSSGGSSSSSGTSKTGSTMVGASPALFNRDTFDYSSSLSYAQEAARYQIMVMQSTNAAQVADLHAANSNLKILMYSMAMYSNPADPNAESTCTSYTSDNTNHPSWFLTDQNGNRVKTGSLYMMDVGNPGYIQACVAHAIQLAQQDGFSGIMFDGINATWRYYVSSGTTVAEYPTDGDWEAAFQKFLNYAGATVEGDGLLATGNLGGTDTSLWESWTAPLSGSAEQSFTDGGQGLAQQVPYWSQNLVDVAWNEAHGKYAILNSYNTTEAGNTYGLASMLLVADGYSSYSANNSNDTSPGDNDTSYEVWYPEYTDAQELGSPAGTYTQLSNGVYERKFQNGIVVVNPTTSAVSSFSLGGTYYGNTTSSTSSVSLPATSGLILLKSSG